MTHNCPANAEFFSGCEFSKTFEDFEAQLKRKIDFVQKNKDEIKDKTEYLEHKKKMLQSVIQIKEIAK